MAMQLYGGNKGGARVYMGTHNREFFGKTPLQMLLTDDASARQVEDLLFAQLRSDVLEPLRISLDYRTMGFWMRSRGIPKPFQD
jgi:hypothetical protein